MSFRHTSTKTKCRKSFSLSRVRSREPQRAIIRSTSHPKWGVGDLLPLTPSQHLKSKAGQQGWLDHIRKLPILPRKTLYFTLHFTNDAVMLTFAIPRVAWNAIPQTVNTLNSLNTILPLTKEYMWIYSTRQLIMATMSGQCLLICIPITSLNPSTNFQRQVGGPFFSHRERPTRCI